MSFREVNDDILKEFWEYRDQTEFAKQEICWATA